MSRNIRVSEPSPEMQIKIQWARRAITSQKMRMVKCPYCDMVACGIIDPAKVTRSALENAVSVSAMALTTEALVADKPEPPTPAPVNPEMNGMY